MRTAFVAVMVLVLAALLAYARDPISMEEWDAYVRTPHTLGTVYKNDTALNMEGQEPLELRPLPGDKKIILAYFLPRGEKPDDLWYEKIAINARFFNMIGRRAGAARAGDTKLENHGWCFQFDSTNTLVIYLVPGEKTAAEYHKMPDQAKTIREEVHRYCKVRDEHIATHFKNYAFLIYAEKFGRRWSNGWFRWAPSVSQPDRTVVFSMRMLDSKVAGASVSQQMDYLGYPNRLTIGLSPQEVSEIMPGGLHVPSRQEATQCVIGAPVNYFATCLGCMRDKYPHSIMNYPDWRLCRQHFGPRGNLEIRLIYIHPDSFKKMKEWIE